MNPGQPFKVLIVNLTKNPVKLDTRQVVATADDHPDIIAEYNITHAKILGLTTTKYKNRDKNVRDCDTVNKHIASAKVAALSNQDEQPIASENMKNYAPKNYHTSIRALLRKNKYLWLGKRGNIRATTHLIGLFLALDH